MRQSPCPRGEGLPPPTPRPRKAEGTLGTHFSSHLWLCLLRKSSPWQLNSEARWEGSRGKRRDRAQRPPRFLGLQRRRLKTGAATRVLVKHLAQSFGLTLWWCRTEPQQ